MRSALLKTRWDAGSAERLGVWPSSDVANKKARAKVDWAKLIGRVAADRDKEAFSLLFAHFAPRVKGLLLRTGSDGEVAEELAQETLLAVWRKAGQFDPASAGAAAWIFTIARNLRIDAARKAVRSGPIDHDAELEYVVDPAASPDDDVLRRTVADQVAEAVKRLPVEQSAAIRMSFIEERPHQEIARSLNLPLGTVKSRIRLALKKLRELMDETS